MGVHLVDARLLHCPTSSLPDFLTAGDSTSQKVLTDVLWRALTGEAAKEGYSPADYSRLETLGVGPLLIAFITNESKRTRMRQQYSEFLPLASCGSLTEYRKPADNTVLTTYSLVGNRAYHRPNVNRFTCAPNRQENGSTCPPNDEKPSNGLVWCKSRFCSKATKTCEDGGASYGSTSGRTGDDHYEGDDGVSFGVVRNDDTTLEVYPSCPRTAATCGNGIDDDNDGYMEDDDDDCWSVRERQEDGSYRIVRESIAVTGLFADGVDNDGDGKADSADRDCDAARAAFAGEQPPCVNQVNDAEWCYVADMTQSHKLFMFGVVIPGVPLFETNIHIDHSKGAACGSSSLRAKVIGVTINVSRKPLVQCTELAFEMNANRLNSEPKESSCAAYCPHYGRCRGPSYPSVSLGLAGKVNRRSHPPVGVAGARLAAGTGALVGSGSVGAPGRRHRATPVRSGRVRGSSRSRVRGEPAPSGRARNAGCAVR